MIVLNGTTTYVSHVDFSTVVSLVNSQEDEIILRTIQMKEDRGMECLCLGIHQVTAVIARNGRRSINFNNNRLGFKRDNSKLPVERSLDMVNRSEIITLGMRMVQLRH